MNALRHIRKEVLRYTQAEMATVAEVSQGTVSKWERGGLSPNQTEMKLIRDDAAKRGIEWNDSWFFEPAEASQ